MININSQLKKNAHRENVPSPLIILEYTISQSHVSRSPFSQNIEMFADVYLKSLSSIFYLSNDKTINVSLFHHYRS